MGKNFSKLTSFEWDKGNLTKNEVSHNVFRNECEEVFFNIPKLIQKDILHSVKEERFYLFGITNAGRFLSIVFTRRENLIRVISARDMNKKKELPVYKKYGK